MSDTTTEGALIELLLARAPTRARGLVVRAGDDAAHLRDGDGLRAVTTDSVVEGVHFQPGWLSAADLAHKAVAVNVSDLAAMGATPSLAWLSLVGPSGAFPDEFAVGLGDACREYGLVLAGGNVAGSPGPTVITLTCEGQLEGEPLLRRGVRPGDGLWVSGPLGLAALGLLALQRGESAPAAVDAFRRPRARVALGRRLAALRADTGVHAAMDLSDGLVADLPRLCAASRVGSEIHVANVPGPLQVPAWAGDARTLALAGGEDYELLFSCAPRAADPTRLARRLGVRVSAIGRVVARPGIRGLPEGGWRHF